MVTYPCPFCGAPADLESGCGGCGRPPYPDAAEVVRLNGRTIELYAEVEAARTRFGAAVQYFNAVQSQRNMLAARVKAAVAAQPAIPPATPNIATTNAGAATTGPAAVTAGGLAATVGAAATAETGGAGGMPPGAWPVHRAGSGRGPETPARTVQNLLFVFGGLLLGSAAIVFAAVAWASFGVLGRAVILGIVTLLTLAVPPVALRRGLRATAETFAALGLLLVLLDGYAAWYANLLGLADLAMPSTYAGLTFLGTTVVAGGYAAFTRLRSARLAAVVAVQPVLPLLALHRGFGVTGWTLVFVCVAAIGVLLGRTVERLAWIAAGVAVLSALPPGLHALSTADGVASAARIFGVLVLLAAVVVAAGQAHPRTVQAGAGIATGIVAVAGARLSGEVLPDARYAAFAAVGLLIACAAIVVPQRFRPGARLGAIVVAGAFAAPYAYFAVVAALQTAGRGLPAWAPEAVHVLPYRLFEWPEPVGVALLGAALWLLLRHRAVPWTAAVLVAFAAPAALPSVDTTLVSIVDAAVLLVLLAATLRADRVAAVAMPFVAGHLALVGLATPATTLVVYAVLGGLSTVVAARAADRRLSLPAAVVALLAVPVAAAAAGRLLGVGTAGSGPVPPALLGATVGLAAVTAAAFGLRNRAHNAGTIATATAGAAVTVAATAQSAVYGGTTWFGTYAAGALAATWIAARAFGSPAAATPTTSTPAADAVGAPHGGEGARPEHEPDRAPSAQPAGEPEPGARPEHALPAVVPLVLALISLLPAVAGVLLRPLGWFGAIWRGAPDGVGLSATDTAWWGGTDAFGPAAAACTLAVLAGLLVAVGRRVGADVWGLAAPAVSLAVMLGCVALEAPWPSVPAVTLAAGLVTGLAAALRRPSRGTAVGGATCWFGILPGLAGLLATPAATLCGLSAIVAAAVLAGLAGRGVGARVLAWPVAGVSAAWLAFAAARAADLPLRAAAYWVLLAAAIALAGGWLLRRRALPSGPAVLDGRVLEAVGHGIALVALVLTAGYASAAAGIVGLWGVALGLRALARPERVAYTGVAVAAEALAYELVLVAGGVSLAEAYTVPVAAVALIAGWIVAGRDPQVNSWTAFGPGLLAGFVPSAALVLVQPDEPLRRLLVGATAVAVVVAGARLRLRAPIQIGGGVIVVVALHEIALYWDYLPRWAPLAVAGALLVGIAVTYERRLRDLTRLRAAIGRMR